MGENFFFVTTVGAVASLGIPGVPWQIALGVVFLSGLIFLLLTVFKIREWIMNAVSENLQYAMAGGIGLFIALLGMKDGGLIVVCGSGFAMNPDLRSVTVLIFATGLLATAILQALRIRGAILIGLAVSLLLALFCGKVPWNGIAGVPPNPMPVFAKMDVATVLANLGKLLPFIVIFSFMDVFDTMGTLFGIGTQADLVRNGKLPGAPRAMAADAVSTVFGAACGNSTVTAYIESATGVQYGGRTGLAAIVTGLCFLLAIFFHPLISMVGAYPGGINPIIAPALVIVGAMMMKNLSKIAWDDFAEAIPAFLILIGIPLTGSIADGMMLGFIAYPIVKTAAGKRREIGWGSILLGLVLLVYLVFVKAAG
jgi:AGZA family xanthine/uracil permease-like MFS transporter